MKPASTRRFGVSRPRRVIAGALLAWLCGARLARADDGSAGAETTEAAIKAAYLYRLSSYVAWPTPSRSTAGPFVIGTLNAPLVHAELAQLLPGRKLEGREIELRRVQEAEAPASVDLLFVGRGAALKDATWRKLASTPGLLVVSEQSDGLGAGAAINFVRNAGRVRLEAAPQAAERNGLKLSARLLAVAERVVPGP